MRCSSSGHTRDRIASEGWDDLRAKPKIYVRLAACKLENVSHAKSDAHPPFCVGDSCRPDDHY